MLCLKEFSYLKTDSVYEVANEHGLEEPQMGGFQDLEGRGVLGEGRQRSQHSVGGVVGTKQALLPVFISPL